jgi:hypothetical protein
MAKTHLIGVRISDTQYDVLLRYGENPSIALRALLDSLGEGASLPAAAPAQPSDTSPVTGPIRRRDVRLLPREGKRVRPPREKHPKWFLNSYGDASVNRAEATHVSSLNYRRLGFTEVEEGFWEVPATWQAGV